ncbi:MAG TPA: NYN domain-containing protein, partial [Spirochaetota bacterium]|nr:NYN domain-containing protein [Spirochaetota bacterium]
MDVFGIPLYIVDGYNVVLSRSFSSDSKDIIREKERFLRAADSYRAKKRVEITVVWDGGPPPGGHGGGARVRSIYSGE